jgi:triosephosphate isomerase
VAEKTAYAVNQGLKVCLCCGETLQEREKNETNAVVCRQVGAVAGTNSGH